MEEDRDWRKYEEQIFERLKELGGPASEVLFNQNLPGHLSEVDRQVDVLVKGAFAGGVAEGTMAVDCKCWGKNVDVMDVDRFVGTIEDLRTDYGLLVTTEGFSDAAKNRAANARGIRVDVVPYQDLAEWGPPLELCQICGGARGDAPPGMVYIDRFDAGPKATLAMGAGQCDRCDAFHLGCHCGAVNSTVDTQLGSWKECDGGCGLEWRVDAEVDHEGLLLETDPRKQVKLRSTTVAE